MSKNLSKLEISENLILFHIVITGKCQGKCKGCINTLLEKDRKKLLFSWEAEVYRESKVILELIKNFKFDNTIPIYIAFYGGEPLLESEKIFEIKKILKDYHNFYYILYTNGLLLRNLIKFNFELLDFKFIIVSIDGTEKQHNKVRPGIDYRKIYYNLRYFKNKINNISIIMWSTLREEQSFKDCFEAFLQLYEEGLVDYFYWHFLDTQESFRNFGKFYENYKRDLEYLLQIYIQNLKKEKILPILPLNELIYFNIYQKRRTTTACKVELMKNFDIVSGKVVPCIDIPFNFYFAKINKKGVLKFKNSHLIQKFFDTLLEYRHFLKCFDCEAYYYCGGRCPVQAMINLERAKNYCELTKLFVKEVKNLFESNRILISKLISIENFYERFVFPVYFTDVIP